jgi:hypothetical protein
MSLRTSRIVYIPLALFLIAFAVFECVKYGRVATTVVVVFAILPDVALIGAEHPGGLRRYLNPSRVRFYNVAHSLWLPAVPIAASFLPLPPFGWGLRSGLELFLAGLAWMAHIALDRSFGYGPRAADGSIKTRPFTREPQPATT